MMPKAYDVAAEQLPRDVEDECLFLSSDFPRVQECQTVYAVALKVEEGRLREGHAYDCLRAIQNAVKTITAPMDKKRKKCLWSEC